MKAQLSITLDKPVKRMLISAAKKEKLAVSTWLNTFLPEAIKKRAAK